METETTKMTKYEKEEQIPDLNELLQDKFLALEILLEIPDGTFKEYVSHYIKKFINVWFFDVLYFFGWVGLYCVIFFNPFIASSLFFQDYFHYFLFCLFICIMIKNTKNGFGKKKK